MEWVCVGVAVRRHHLWVNQKRMEVLELLVECVSRQLVCSRPKWGKTSRQWRDTWRVVKEKCLSLEATKDTETKDGDAKRRVSRGRSIHYYLKRALTPSLHQFFFYTRHHPVTNNYLPLSEHSSRYLELNKSYWKDREGNHILSKHFLTTTHPNNTHTQNVAQINDDAHIAVNSVGASLNWDLSKLCIPLIVEPTPEGHLTKTAADYWSAITMTSSRLRKSFSSQWHCNTAQSVMETKKTRS